MSNKASINEIIANPELLNIDGCWSFYDWFCKKTSLENKAKSFIPKLKFLVNNGIVNGDTCYVWFKNNCPMNGTLYDDMRISRISDDQFLGGICPRTGHKNTIDGLASYWLLREFGDLNTYNFENWTEMKKELLNIAKEKSSYIYF
mgnify:CR=1 FL=1